MAYTEIVSLIGSLGFPIVMCLLLLDWFKKIQEQHKEEMDKLSESLQNNTLALTVLASKIESIVDRDRKDGNAA